VFQRTVSAPTPAALVDSLLVAVAELADEAARVGAKVQPPPDGEEKKPEPAPPQPKEKKPDEPPPAPDDGARSPQAPARDGSLAFGAAAGGAVALNQLGGIGGTVGPRAALLLGLPGSITLAAGGAYGFGFGGSAAVSIRTAEGTLVASTLFGARRSFEIGVGAAVGVLMVGAPGFTTSDPTSPVFFAAIARARYGWTDGAWRISLGPELRFYANPTSVQLDGLTVWEIPTVTAGITLDLATAFSGSLW
jgi:hypothetical protein